MEPTSRYRKICAVSDSLTSDAPDNWLALLGAMRPGLQVVAEAHGGWTTHSYFKSKFDGVAFARVPRDADLFILLIGSNNLFEAEGGSAVAVDEATEGVARLARHVLGLSPGADILLVAPPKVVLAKCRAEEPKPARRIDVHTPEFLKRLGDSYRALAARKGWLFADLLPVLSDADYVDAAHPNAQGNRKMAQAIWAAIK